MGRGPGPSSWRPRVFLKASGRAGEVHLSCLAWLQAAQPLGASVLQECFVCQGAGLQPSGDGEGGEASLWNEHICPAAPSTLRALSQVPHRSPHRPPRSPQVQNKTKAQILPFRFPAQDINLLSVSAADLGSYPLGCHLQPGSPLAQGALGSPWPGKGQGPGGKQEAKPATVAEGVSPTSHWCCSSTASGWPPEAGLGPQRPEACGLDQLQEAGEGKKQGPGRNLSGFQTLNELVFK